MSKSTSVYGRSRHCGSNYCTAAFQQAADGATAVNEFCCRHVRCTEHVRRNKRAARKKKANTKRLGDKTPGETFVWHPAASRLPGLAVSLAGDTHLVQQKPVDVPHFHARVVQSFRQHFWHLRKGRHIVSYRMRQYTSH